MINEEHLESLFEKLINESLSKSEMTELSKYFTESSASVIFDDYFKRIWDTPHPENEMHSDLLHKIYQKTGITQVVTDVKKSQNLSVKIFKFAAVFLIAFGLSYFLNNLYNRLTNSDHKGLSETNEVEVAYGSRSKIRLPDGSVVNLNSGSKLTYPLSFNKDNRTVNLEGEAYFNVKTIAGRPFFVNVSEIVIKVTGTSFNVKSYPGSNFIETILLSGSLEIFEKKQIGDDKDFSVKPMILKPNQEAIYIRDPEMVTPEDQQELRLETGIAKLSRIALSDSMDFYSLVAWNDDKLVFNDERFEDLAIRLERWFDVKIIINGQDLKKERFTGIFENETIEQVLEALRIAESFDYTIIKNKITIFKN